MQISRLFEITYLLLQRGSVTARELGEHFEVSTRTIYRDVETLSQAGIPIYSKKGKYGGISLMEGFVLNKSVLSHQERRDIIGALQALAAARPEEESEQHSALPRLRALFGDFSSSWVEIDFSDWSGISENTFQLLRGAILTRRVLSFDYYSSAGILTHRTVEPLQLWFKHRAWYLRAFCLARMEERTFRISRLKRPELGGAFEERPDASPAESSFLQEAPQVSLRLLVDSSQAYRVYDEFVEGCVHRQEDGDFYVEVTYPEDEWVYGFLLSFGPNVTVLEPPRIRTLLCDRMKKALEKNMKYDTQVSASEDILEKNGPDNLRDPQREEIDK